MAKKTKVRQRIPMEKMEKESNLQVTFSKRRSGWFKKASDLCILWGVEIAIVVFSPSKKAFCFGHPSVEMMADGFLQQQLDLPSTPQQQPMQAHPSGRVSELINTQLTYAECQLEAAKNKSEELAKISKERLNNPRWCDAPIEGMELQELEKLMLAMGLLKGDIDERKKKMTASPLQIAGHSNSGSVHGGDFIANGSGLELRMTPHGLVLGNRHSDP